MAKLCTRCGERPAKIPDRERMGRPIKRICLQCHRERLQSDFIRILNKENKR